MLKKSIGALALACIVLLVPITATATDNVSSVEIGTDNVTAVSGGTFNTYINLTSIPSNGISAMDFAISYDKDIILVEELALVGVRDNDILFDYVLDEDNGIVNVTLVSSSSGITSEGAFIKVTGRVLAKALTGTKAEISLVPISRKSYVGATTDNTEINVGYAGDGEAIKYDVAVTSGYVAVAANGDVNKDGCVDTTDVAIVLKYILNGDTADYDILSADIAEEYGTIDMRDAIQILKS